MKIQEFGGRQIAFGADWVTLPGADSQAVEIKRMAKEARSKFYVSMDRKGKRPIFGFYKKSIGRKPNYSAATLITIAITGLKNAVFSFRLNGGESAIICFVDGLPMVGYDIVGRTENVEVKLHEFLNTLDDAALYGDFRLFSAHFNDVQPFDFNNIKIDEKLAAKAVFRRASLPSSVWIGLCGLGVFSIASYLGYDWYQQEQLKAIKAKLVDPNVAYESNLRNLLNETGFSAGPAALSIIPSIAQTPLFMGGWKQNNAKCIVGNCKHTWTGDTTLPSTFEGFKASMPSGWSADYKSDFQTIESSFLIHHENKKGIDIDRLLKTNDFVVSIGTEVQRLKAIGADFQISKPNLFGVPQLPPDQTPITINVLKNPVFEGSWSISGPWWLAEYVQSLPPTMTLSSMELINASQGLNLKVEGKYYVNK